MPRKKKLTRPEWVALMSKREALLDSYSDPPSEDDFWGSPLAPVIEVDGCVVGEWNKIPREDRDDAVGRARYFPFTYVSPEESHRLFLERKEREAKEKAEAERQAELERTAAEREQVAAEERAVQLALKKMNKRDYNERARQRRIMNIALGKTDKSGRKLDKPFGKPLPKEPPTPWEPYVPPSNDIIIETGPPLVEYRLDGQLYLVEPWLWDQLIAEAYQSNASFDDWFRWKLPTLKRGR